MQNNSVEKIAVLIKSSWTKIFDQKQIRLDVEDKLSAAVIDIETNQDEDERKIKNITVSWVEFKENLMTCIFEFQTKTKKGTAIYQLDLNNFESTPKLETLIYK